MSGHGILIIVEDTGFMLDDNSVGLAPIGVDLMFPNSSHAGKNILDGQSSDTVAITKTERNTSDRSLSICRLCCGSFNSVSG